MMDHIITVKPYPSKSPVAIINEQLAGRLDILRKKRGFVSFGTQRNFVDIVFSRETKEGEILLSANVIENLHIPDYPTFEVRTLGNEIIIGPCIGILSSEKYEDITKRRLKEISMSTLDYPRIRGAVIVFSLDRVDKAGRLVEGYCYNPGDDSWSKGIFPYPLAIYLRSSLDDEWKNHFLSIIGDNVFNNYSFSKWEMYKWFSREKDIVPNLPHTRIYESARDIYDMLQKHGVVYIKPIWGMKGFGVIKASAENGRVVFKYRKDEENEEITASTTMEVDAAAAKLFKAGGHIIQQGLDLLNFRDGVVDFRCVMQKDDTRSWVCSDIVARTGAKGSVVSNISSGGAALPALELIKEALPMSDARAFAFRERMVSLCMKICRTLDEYGLNYGALGLDLGVDKDGHIWLIEVNNRRPHPAIALRANEVLSYYTILASPLYYARALAGFGCGEETKHVL